MRALLLAATLLASSSALAQEAADLASLIAHPDAQLLSAENAAAMGVEAEGPVWVIPAEAVDERASLSYELPASVLPSEKDPGLAIIIGILLPGGGQIYAGDNTKGLTILGVAYGSLIGGWFLGHALDVPLLYLVGSAGYIAATVYGVLQATDDVEAANRRNGYALAPSVTRTHEGYAAGLSLRASF
ncbi:MAG: hypothetical protein AAF170_01025 [Bacteroidota bacterium]